MSAEPTKTESVPAAAPAGVPEPQSAATTEKVTNNEVPVPYNAIGTPKINKVDHNGASFKTVEWEHAGDYQGTIIYVHGFAEQSGMYTEFFDRLSQKGYDIFFFDQRGAGDTSPGKEYGKTEEKYQMGDLDFFIDYNGKKAGKENEKFTLMGHSMGGGIVLNYGIIGKRREKVKNIVSNAPMIALHPATAPNVILTTLSSVINKLVPNLKIDSKLNYDYITSNEKWKKYLKAHDAKLIGSVRLFHDMFARGDLLSKPYHNKNWSKDIPLLILHGTDDKINFFDASKKFYAALPAGVEKEFYEIPNGRHSIFIESEEIVSKAIDKVDEFLKAHK